MPEDDPLCGVAGPVGTGRAGWGAASDEAAPQRRPGADCEVRFLPAERTVKVAAGATIEDALATAGLAMQLPCGGQGRCGRCVVEVREGEVRRRSVIRLTEEELARGCALACQTVLEGDAVVWVPPAEERFERFERGDRAEKAALEPPVCPGTATPWVVALPLDLSAPSISDNTADLERVQVGLARQHDLREVTPTLTALTDLPQSLRDGEWHVTAVVEQGNALDLEAARRLLAVVPGTQPVRTWGAAIDIGTTTVAVWLGDLETGRLVDQASAYNGQIACGEDVISRIMYGRRPERRWELQQRVVQTINGLLDHLLERQGGRPDDVKVAVVAGNTTMTHLFLGLQADFIRLEPYVPAAARFAPQPAVRLGLHMHPEAMVDCLPAVGAYVGGDITAGVLRAGFHREDPVTLFLDVGTNGEMVLGNSEWLLACACSAGPAFEGAGVASGMRAVDGAIEEVWIDPHTLEPTVITLGDTAPRGICGSGMISLLSELRATDVIDKSGRMVASERTNRVRAGGAGLEYVVVWAEEAGGRDVVVTETDIQNLLRAKAAVYAGAAVLCDSVGLAMTDVERVLIGGAFGRHIDVQKAVAVGLLPDLPWEAFSYLGNTSVQGAYLALTCREYRRQLDDLAGKMTYLELSADNRFMDAFTSALFIPHTDLSLFPSVMTSSADARKEGVEAP